MPPVRTMPTVKPVKTERTHEENQERAYIAASRRSDRSLEARIESARRASEIHKKRTGRALRVTEDDVVNEEMYEEEDEDLPAQYRRLTAHLQTGSVDFNRRFHAYLLSHHGTRSAVANFDPTIANNIMQYPNAPYFANPMMHTFSPQILTPQMSPHSPQSYRHAPYPMSPGSNFKSQPHQRSASVATPQELQNQQPSNQAGNRGTSEDHRRMSLPVQELHSGGQTTPTVQAPPSLSRNSSSSTIPRRDSQQPQNIQRGPIPKSEPSSDGSSTQSIEGFPDLRSPALDSKNQNFSFSPFSSSLPAEAQMFLGPALDPLDPRTQLLMAGSDAFPQPFSYSYNPNPSSKSKIPRTLSNGMNQTLAPAVPALDIPSDGSQMPGHRPMSSQSADDQYSMFNSTFGFNFDDGFIDPAKMMMTRNSSAQGSTDGANDWANLINGNIWDESAA